MRVIAATGKTDTSAEMDELKRRVAALRAAENHANEVAHRQLTKALRLQYVAFITDEHPDIQWPKKIARLFTVLTAQDMMADGAIPQEKRFTAIIVIFIFWSGKEAVATLTWSHLALEMKSLLPLDVDDQEDIADFCAKWAEVMWNNHILAMVKQDASAKTLEPLLKYCECFLFHWRDCDGERKRLLASLPSLVSEAMEEVRRFVAGVTGVLNPHPMAGGSTSDDVAWIFWHPQSGVKKPVGRAFKEINRITKAIWHHLQGPATAEGKNETAVAKTLWQRLKVTYNQHCALDAQYAEPLDQLGVFFRDTSSGSYFDNVEEFHRRCDELEVIKSNLRPKATETECALLAATIQEIYGDVISMAEKPVENDTDKNMLSRLRSVKKLCSIAGRTGRLPTNTRQVHRQVR